MIFIVIGSALLLFLAIAIARLVPIVRAERIGQQSGRYADIASDWLLPGEQVVLAAIAVLVSTASGMRLPARGSLAAPASIGHAVGNRLGRVGAISGGVGSVAGSLPSRRGGKLLVLTDQRLLLGQLHAGQQRELLWARPRTALSGVRRRPRLQLMARFRLHFTDGSSAAILTPSAATPRKLQSALQSPL